MLFEDWMTKMRSERKVPFGTAYELFAREAWNAAVISERNATLRGLNVDVSHILEPLIEKRIAEERMNYCETCKFRDNDGLCLSDKLSENYNQNDNEKIDMLVFSYDEGGSFYVGPKFGCVHHEL